MPRWRPGHATIGGGGFSAGQWRRRPQPAAGSAARGYRKWQLVGVSQETGGFDELRAVVGNAVALQAFQSSTLPFPDGTMLVKIAWQRHESSEFAPAFVPGAPMTVQVMVKDSARYGATGGWGFGRFIDGKPVDEAQHRTCFACHSEHVQNHDFVFTRFAP